MTIKPLLKGICTYVPVVGAYRTKRTGGTNSARYCYSVWLRHLVMAHRNGLCRNPPPSVLELGPGDSLGIGLAALLTGAAKYHGLDVIRYSSIERNLAVFEELLALFRNREDIPGDKEFPRIRPALDSYEFPLHILTRDTLAKLLDDGRIDGIRRSIASMNELGSSVSYVTGSLGPGTIPQQSVDMVLTQAVLQYVEPLLDTHRLIKSWLRPGGFVSHTIDFSSHELATEWNGHWSYSDLTWTLIRGKRASFLTRQPHSAHVRMLEEAGFRVVCEFKEQDAAVREQPRPAARFADLSPEDRITRTSFIQAVIRDRADRG